MADLTIIYLTINRIPFKFTQFQRHILSDAAKGYPIISISREPIDFGDTKLIQSDPICASNIFAQMLRGAKLADTPYIAIAEDDCLYTSEHFNFCRPDKDVFAYNMNRWSLTVWEKDIMFSMYHTLINATLIAPRDYLIEALEERYRIWPNGPPPRMGGELGKHGDERAMGVTPHKVKEAYSYTPVIQFEHDYFSEANAGPEAVARRHRKRRGPIRAYDIYYWGKATELAKRFE